VCGFEKEVPLTELMPDKQLWAAVHAERAELAEDLATLNDGQWASPSLCEQWSVEQVAAHLTAAASTGPLRWIGSAIGARFDFDLHNARRLAEHLGPTPADTLSQFRRVITSTTSPFGPTAAWLGEVVVHGEDIRRALGLVRPGPVETVTEVAIFFARRNFTVNSKRIIAGLRMEASDGPFAGGEGPVVRGTTLALTMALAGRAAFSDELEGPGVRTLRSRLGAPSAKD
jgi:uncharacterized protein (TIGR03083 family)